MIAAPNFKFGAQMTSSRCSWSWCSREGRPSCLLAPPGSSVRERAIERHLSEGRLSRSDRWALGRPVRRRVSARSAFAGLRCESISADKPDASYVMSRGRRALPELRFARAWPNGPQTCYWLPSDLETLTLTRAGADVRPARRPALKARRSARKGRWTWSRVSLGAGFRIYRTR